MSCGKCPLEVLTSKPGIEDFRGREQNKAQWTARATDSPISIVKAHHKKNPAM